ncbi:MAG: hypothetical protein IKK33_12095 [Lachnospiraceae bacterium]|nr:hypothetical protein [Lachnospiraceae bacterium]
MDILFVENSTKSVVELNLETVKDLALEEIVDFVARGESEKKIIRGIFTKIPSDLEDIRYRQEILKDFMENEVLVEELTEVLQQIKALKEYADMKTAMMNQEQSLYVLLEKLRELSVYVNVVENMVNCLKKHRIEAKGLKNVLKQMEDIVNDESFSQAKQDIQIMLEELSNVRGAMVAVNFTPDLNIEQVTAIEFVPHRLRSKYKLAEFAASMHNVINTSAATGSHGGAMVTTRVIDPLLATMTPHIEKHLKKHFTKIRQIMTKYVKMDGVSITEMYEGFTFYLAMARFGQRLRNYGCDICIPELTQGTGNFEIKDLYNVRLFFAGEKNIVKNDFTFTPKENLYILTGPNRGGKTVIEQALGIISVMASIGSFVTASCCTGSPFTNVLTHFPIDENLTINYGRLGEEAVRIRDLVAKADNRTLILFNETYSTTSATDGLYLSMDLLRVLKELGTAVIFNTHIHELAMSINEMNGWDGESDIVSIVMEIKDDMNTFRLKRCEPELKSYAKNIALKYEITYEQMIHNRKN